MSATTLFPLAVWLEGTNQNSTPANDNSLRIEALMNPAKGTANAAPSSPADHDQWIVGTTWGGHASGNIVIWLSGAWKEFAAYDGLLKVIGTTPSLRDSGAWTALSGGGSSSDAITVTGFTDAEIDAAVTTINSSANGGTVLLPVGTYTWSTAKTFTKPVTIRGEGCGDDNMDNALTNINFTSATVDCIHFTVDPAQVYDLQVNNTASTTPTAGAGIHWDGGNGLRMTGVNSNGFWNPFQVDNGAEWFTDDIVSFGPVNYGAYVRNVGLPDGGDQSFSGWQFIAHNHNAVAALRYESGGGFKGVDLKVNQRGSSKFVTGIDVEIDASAVTSDFLVTNSSIENVSGNAIKLRNSSGGTLKNIIIQGNEFSNYSATLSPIDISATTTGVFDVLLIDDNEFNIASSSAACISITNVDNVGVGICRQAGHPALLALSGVTNCINANAQYHSEALTDGSTISVDLTNSDSFRLTLGGNHTMANPTNLHDAHRWQVRVKQDSTGSRTLSFGSKYKKSSTYALSTAANALDVLSFQYDASDDFIMVVSAVSFA